MTTTNVLKLTQARKEKWVAQMEQSEWAEVGAGIRTTRENLGLTILDVSRNVGVSESTISRFERGKSVTSARLLESAIKLYFKSVSGEVEDDSDSFDGYSSDIVDGEVCLICNYPKH